MTSKPLRALFRRLAILAILIVAVLALPASGELDKNGGGHTGCGEPYYEVRCGSPNCSWMEPDYSVGCVDCNEGTVCYNLNQ
jgi:hypothetical protein